MAASRSAASSAGHAPEITATASTTVGAASSSSVADCTLDSSAKFTATAMICSVPPYLDHAAQNASVASIPGTPVGLGGIVDVANAAVLGAAVLAAMVGTTPTSAVVDADVDGA